MKHRQLKLVMGVDAHNRFQATYIIENPYKAGQIISIAHDGFIRTWESSNLCLTGSYRIKSPYLMCIVPFNGGFLLGIGNGSILQLNSSFQILKQHPLHQDCLTCIQILPKFIVTTSYDSKIHFLNKQTFKVEHTIQLNGPINECIFLEDYLYIASNPSYKINVNTFEKTSLGYYKQFIIHQKQVFGCSDQQGITNLNDKINISVPCHYMLSIGESILISSDGGVGILYYDQINEGQWFIQTKTTLSRGDAILSGVYYNGQLFLTGQSSYIYKFEIVVPLSKKKSQVSQQRTVSIQS